MARPYPLEFRQQAVELARLGQKPRRAIAAELGISESCLYTWIERAESLVTGQSQNTADSHELAALRRELRNTKMENEILKRAAAYFAKENVLPK
ncbi:MAG: transposase [Pseudonocardiaceae bacterium]